MSSKIPKSPAVGMAPVVKSRKSSTLPRPTKLMPLPKTDQAPTQMAGLAAATATVLAPVVDKVSTPPKSSRSVPIFSALVAAPRMTPPAAEPMTRREVENFRATADISKALRSLEEQLMVRQVRTVETGVGTGEDRSRSLILLRADTFKLDHVVDEEKEQLKKELIQARRHNAALYVLLAERNQEDRAPVEVRMPVIPRLDLEGERRRRVRQGTPPIHSQGSS